MEGTGQSIKNNSQTDIRHFSLILIDLFVRSIIYLEQSFKTTCHFGVVNLENIGCAGGSLKNKLVRCHDRDS